MNSIFNDYILIIMILPCFAVQASAVPMDVKTNDVDKYFSMSPMQLGGIPVYIASSAKSVTQSSTHQVGVTAIETLQIKKKTTGSE